MPRRKFRQGTRYTVQEPRKRTKGCAATTVRPAGRGNRAEAHTAAIKSQKRAKLLLLAETTNCCPAVQQDSTAAAMKERPKSIAEMAAKQTVRQSHCCTPSGTSPSHTLRADNC